MNEEEWLKAIKCTKEELIEWLNEMYRDEKTNREIIFKYEEFLNVGKEKKGENTIIRVAPDFQYYRHNW